MRGTPGPITWHVSTRDVAGGDWSTAVVEGLHPPWGRLAGPLVYLARDHTTNTNRIELYDRDSRERVAEIDVTEITGLGGGYQPQMLDGTDLLAVMAVDPTDRIGDRLQAYVLVFDIVTRKVVSKIRVGPGFGNLTVVKRARPVWRMFFGG